MSPFDGLPCYSRSIAKDREMQLNKIVNRYTNKSVRACVRAYVGLFWPTYVCFDVWKGTRMSILVASVVCKLDIFSLQERSDQT